MTHADFLDLLQSFSQRPIPAATRSARHLYVWRADIEMVVSNIPSAQRSLLDLHALCQTLDTTPSSPNLARQKLERALSDWLTREFPPERVQRVLIVTGCDLLARYGASLGLFSQRANESTLIVFSVPLQDSNYQPRALPAFIHLQPNATFSFFASFDDAIVGG